MHPLLVLGAFCSLAAAGKDRPVNLRDVNVLTFKYGKKTTGKRTAPIPQLQCTGSACDDDDAPSSIACHNEGTDDVGDVIWRCNAEVDDDVLFGDINVNCEGFNGPGDDLVLAGSCSLSYSLNYRSGRGRKSRFDDGHLRPHRGGSHMEPMGYDSRDFADGRQRHASKGSWMPILLLGALALIVYLCSGRAVRDPTPRPDEGVQRGEPAHHRPGGFGMGGWGGMGWGGMGGGGYSRGGWRPGFFSGLGTGGLMGYTMGRQANRPASPVRGGYGLGGTAAGVHDAPSSPHRRTATAYGGTTTRGTGGFFKTEQEASYGTRSSANSRR